MNKRHWIILATTLVLMAALLLPACAEPAPTPTPTPTPSPAPAKVWELKFHNGAPPVAEISKALDRWAANVEKMTDGRVKTTLYHGGTLLASREAYRGVQEGVADATYSPVSLYGLEESNLTNLMHLPFVGFPSLKAGSEIFRELVKKFPEIGEGLQDIQLVYGSCISPQHLHTTKKLVCRRARIPGRRSDSPATNGMVHEPGKRTG